MQILRFAQDDTVMLVLLNEVFAESIAKHRMFCF